MVNVFQSSCARKPFGLLVQAGLLVLYPSVNVSREDFSCDFNKSRVLNGFVPRDHIFRLCLFVCPFRI